MIILILNAQRESNGNIDEICGNKINEVNNPLKLSLKRFESVKF